MVPAMTSKRAERSRFDRNGKGALSRLRMQFVACFLLSAIKLHEEADAFRFRRQLFQPFRHHQASRKLSIVGKSLSSLRSRNSRIRGGGFQQQQQQQQAKNAKRKESPSFVIRLEQSSSRCRPVFMSAPVLEEVEAASSNKSNDTGASAPSSPPSSTTTTKHDVELQQIPSNDSLPYFASETALSVVDPLATVTPLRGSPVNGQTTPPPPLLKVNGEAPVVSDSKENQAQRDGSPDEDILPSSEKRRWWRRGPLRLVFRDGADNSSSSTAAAPPTTTRSIWRHRHARSAEEGIRREKTTSRRPPTLSSARLSSVLAKANGSIDRTSRHYAARTITGLINALAEEVDDLDVEVESRRNTPWHNKHVDAVRIKFSRLGFKPLRMGGHESPEPRKEAASRLHYNFLYRNWRDLKNRKDARNSEVSSLTADDAFDRIDVDKSGFLDRDELLQALSLAARTSNSTLLSDDMDNSESNLAILEDLASDLFELYDINGDGVVDRKEYKNMVEDMAALRRADARSEQRAQEQQQRLDQGATPPYWEGWTDKAFNFFQNRTWWWSPSEDRKLDDSSAVALATSETSSGPLSFLDKFPLASVDETPLDGALDSGEKEGAVGASSEVMGVTKTFGSITFSDLKMDVRQIIFGALPVVKRLTPGGPLILEPFTTTITGSFNREDIMNSILLDMGLRRLVMRVVRKRVGSVRDILEGAMFKGRSWKTFGGEGGPKVEITELTNVEFDEDDKLIVTGRARVRTRPEAAVFEQAFKVRTSIGTLNSGHNIRLEEPELALVVECPKEWENA